MLISLTYWSLLKDHVVLSFLFIFCLLAATYSSCLQDCDTVRFILLHLTIFLISYFISIAFGCMVNCRIYRIHFILPTFLVSSQIQSI